MIKGIIFDFDGLILDTETHHYNLLQEFFFEHESELPLSLWQQEIGTQSGFSPFKYLEEKINKKIDHEAILEEFDKRLATNLTEVKARPGVVSYLKSAQELGLKIGLASSSNYQWVSSHLKNLQIFDYFECIKTSDDVQKVKPDPALYLQTAQCLGLDAAECLAFEDSANGALAAKRAGMSCVIVPNEMTDSMDFCQVEHRLDSMAQMKLENVIEIVTKSLST